MAKGRFRELSGTEEIGHYRTLADCMNRPYRRLLYFETCRSASSSCSAFSAGDDVEVEWLVQTKVRTLGPWQTRRGIAYCLFLTMQAGCDYWVFQPDQSFRCASDNMSLCTPV